MKVFLSWSGERSKHIAKSLKNWLPKVIQSTSPWMSEEDITAGSRWSLDISRQLDDTNFGIICITPENQNKPWVLFEAGALSKSLTDGCVSPVVFDMPLSQLSGPLAMFQGVELNKSGIGKLLTSINKNNSTQPLDENEIHEIFEVWWDKLQNQLDAIPQVKVENITKRSADDILDEIVANTREILRRDTIDIEGSIKRSSEMKEMLEKVRNLSKIKIDIDKIKEDKEKGKEELVSIINQYNQLGFDSILGNMMNRLIDETEERKKLLGDAYEADENDK